MDAACKFTNRSGQHCYCNRGSATTAAEGVATHGHLSGGNRNVWKETGLCGYRHACERSFRIARRGIKIVYWMIHNISWFPFSYKSYGISMFYGCYFPWIKKNVNIILIGYDIFLTLPLKKAGFSGKNPEGSVLHYRQPGNLLTFRQFIPRRRISRRNPVHLRTPAPVLHIVLRET